MKVSWAARICIARSSRTREKVDGRGWKEKIGPDLKGLPFTQCYFGLSRPIIFVSLNTLPVEGRNRASYRCIQSERLSLFPFFFLFFSPYNVSPLHGDAAVERNDLKSWMKASIKFASDRHLRRNRNVWPTVANEWPKEKCYRGEIRPRNNSTDPPCTFFLLYGE